MCHRHLYASAQGRTREWRRARKLQSANIPQIPDLSLSQSAVHAQQPREQGGPLKEMHPIAPQRRPNSPCFMHLFRLALTRSRPAESCKANQFLAHVVLLVGPEALSRPATAQKSLGRGRSGWATRRRSAQSTNGHAPHCPQAQNPQEGGGLVASPHMGGGFSGHNSE
jgi:hypothetical protein